MTTDNTRDLEGIVKRLATTPERMALINDEDCIEGYRDGRDNAPMPGDNRSDSYAHGWWTGMRDGHHREEHFTDWQIVDAWKKHQATLRARASQ